MDKRTLSLTIVLIVAVTIFAGCISGGDGNGDVETTAAPTTNAPTTSAPTTSAPTQPPTTAPSTPAYVHNECSTLYMNQDPGNTRYYDCTLSTNPEEVWSLDITMTLSYIMADYERIFYIDRESSDYELKCRDVDSGELYWETSLPFLRYYDLILQNEKLYVFEDGDEKTLICYDAHDGSMLWTSDDVYELYPEVGELMVTGMNYADGKVIVTLGEMGSDTIIFCSFNAVTGDVSWHKTFDYFNSSSNPSIDGGIMYYSVALWDENDQVIGIDIDTGNIAYVYSNPLIENFNGREIVVSNGRIYAMVQRLDTYRLYVVCISIASNNIVWQYDIGDSWAEDITVGDDHVFVNRFERIICLNKGNGQEIWSIPMDYHTVNIPIATSDFLLVFRTHYQAEIPPQLLLIDNASGEEIWRFTLDGNYIQNGASFYEGKILIGTDLGKIYCFE